MKRLKIPKTSKHAKSPEIVTKTEQTCEPTQAEYFRVLIKPPNYDTPPGRISMILVPVIY